jgi:putative endopeptidase
LLFTSAVGAAPDTPDANYRPHLVLISIDGFRWDYPELHPAPAIRALAARGVRAEALLPVFPTLTFPNHYSIVTGLYPARHGIVANEFLDRERGEWYVYKDQASAQDGTWYRGEPVWVSAEKAGLRSAAYFFVGTEAEIQGLRPSRWHAYDESVSGAERVEAVLEWLREPPETRPQFVTLYFEDVDVSGHRYGPDSAETATAIARVDGYLARLVAGIAGLPHGPQVSIVLLSDHGQASYREAARPFVLDEHVSLAGLQPVDGGSYLFLYFEHPDAAGIAALRRTVNSRWDCGQAYRPQDTPAAWRVRPGPRTPDLMLLPEPGCAVLSSATKAHKLTAGDHGWPPGMQEMRGVLIAAGPTLPAGLRLPPVRAVDVHPLLTGLLGLPPADGVDADPAVLGGLLRPAVAADEPAAETPTGPASGVHLDALDRATRPQDDFYQFANGGWLDRTEIPEIYSGYTVYHQVYEEAERALHQIVEAAAAKPGEPGSESQQVGDIYRSWMDEEAIDALGVEPVRADLDAVASVEDAASLARLMARLERAGIQSPYAISIFPDLKNSAEYAVYFEQDGLTMPDRDYYLQPDNENFRAAREALPGYIERLLVQSGMDAEAAAAAAPRVLAIEQAIAAVHWDKVDNRDPEKIYNPYPLDQLASLGTHIDWSATVDILGLQAADQLIIEQPSYFEALDRLLAELPLDDWKAYFTFRVMDGRAQHLDRETAAIRFDYRARTLFGQQQERPRWKLGISAVNALVGEAVGKLYVAGHFPPEAKARMEELVGNVIATLDESLAELEWMSPETRERAKEKLAKFTPKIGYPDEWKDYSDLEIVAGDHIGNLRRAIEWNHRQEIAKLQRPVDRKEWFMTPQTVNAYYDQSKNEIVFPAARLQPPFFQLQADDAINYGAVGGVIGHEISHGFDDKGSKFDGDGNLVNWWTEADRAAFEERTRVLVEQYSAFEPVPGMQINGELTLGENIGDVSGVAMAYRAYLGSLDGREPPVIDGFTGPQRFFIGYAMSRKGKYQPQAEVSLLASDPHSPLKYRVNGVYRNLDAFHEAFGTRPGDGMWLAPEERVRIW